MPKKLPDFDMAFEVVQSFLEQWAPYAVMQDSPASDYREEALQIVRELPRIEDARDAANVLARAISLPCDSDIATALERYVDIGAQFFDVLMERGLLIPDV